MRNITKRSAWVGSTVLTLLLLCPPPFADGEAEAPADPPHREVMDQPPASYRPRDDISARSRGLRATVGSYTSIQVNVDELDLNIVGDAANEPSIAVNPTHPNNLIIGWRQFDSIASNFRQAGYAFSNDRGQSWTFPGVLTPGTFRSDPVLDFDSAGNAYFHSLQESFDVEVFKSPDGGLSWGSPVFAYGGDKNWMAIDRSGGIGDGNIYGVWQALVGCCGRDHFNRSEDGAQSFDYPVDTVGNPGMGTLAVGPEGDVHAAGIDETFFQDFGKFVATRSTNAQDPGATPTFTGSVIPLNASLAFAEGPNPAGLLGQVNVAVDASDGPSNGFVYVLASVDQNTPNTNPTDVLFTRSEDGGTTWSSPKRVNDDAANGGAWHWLGALSVAPNGRLDAIWADTRNSGQTNISELFYAYSLDHGDSWSPNVAVSPSFNSHVGWPQQNKIGDYYTIISDATGANAAYAATFNGEQDVYYIRLFPDCNDNGRSDVTDLQVESWDCNSNLVPDECEEILVDCGPAGATPDGKFVSGTPLRLDKPPNGTLKLLWGPSCLEGDLDYAIYEGDLGDYTSHVGLLCSTARHRLVYFDLIPTSKYYLIVPRNGSHEGSYGWDSSGERPTGTSTCLPQAIAPCPASAP